MRLRRFGVGPAVAVLLALAAARAPAVPADPALVELRDQLAALLAGSLPDSTSVAQLFSVSPDDFEAVRRRVPELEGEIAALEARRRQPAPGDPTPQADAEAGFGDSGADPIALRLEIARSRSTYLRSLLALLERMPDAARRSLRSIAAPREALRGRIRALEETGTALSALADRLLALRARAAAGALVGFRAEGREVAANLDALASSLSQRAGRYAEVARELESAAAEIESEGRTLRRALLLAAALPDPAAPIDGLFLDRVREQRSLRKVADRLRDGAAAGPDVSDLLRDARALLSDPTQPATLREAQEVADGAAALLERADASLDAESAGRVLWRLAFENEAVALLAAAASDGARQRAYAFSEEIVGDVRAELRAAWEGAAELASIRRRQLAELPSRLATAAGARGAARALGIAAVLAAWLLARRYNSRLVVAAVKRLSALRSVGSRVGTAVRWAGLVQAILPVLLSYPAALLVFRLLGPETPEARLLEAVFLPVFLFLLGARLLAGATRRMTTGRPAMVTLSPDIVARLRRTYERLGIVVAAAAVIARVMRATLGVGRIATAAGGVALLWVAVWASIEAIAWRRDLARAWLDLLDEDRERSAEGRLAAWMARHRAGFLLSPWVLVRLLVHHGRRRLLRTTWMRELAARVRARSLRRLVRSADEGVPTPPPALPEAYLAEFPLYPILGSEGAVLLPRDETLSGILEQIERWRADRSEGSLVLHGEKGLGKTTLASLVARSVRDLEVVEVTLRGKPVTEEQLIARLAPCFGPAAGASDAQALAGALLDGPERVVLLDEAHNVFLRVVSGYRAYDALVDLVNATSERVFWILVFNSFTWRFLNESRARMHYFRRVLSVPHWSHEEIHDLIRRRNERTGFSVEFDELLLAADDAVRADGLELVEGADGYFRLLTEASGGNPRVATRLWLSSLTPQPDDRLRVGIFRETSEEALAELPDDLFFALAAICQHENLDDVELARVLNTSDGFARFAIRFLSEAGLVESKDGSADRVTLAPDAYHRVLRALRAKHLLLE